MRASNELVAYYTAGTAVELRKLGRLLRSEADVKQRFQQYVSHLRANPKLEACTLDSHRQALLDCASLDLWPGPHGHMYLIPYKGVATAIPGYKGLIRLLRRGGVVTKISSNVVYSHEPFEYDAGTVDEIDHTPLPPATRGDPIAVYAVAHYRHGPPQPVVMWWEEIQEVKAAAPGSRKADSPWNGPPRYIAEMAKKTAIRRLVKLVGEDDPQLAAAVALMDRADGYQVAEARPARTIEHRPAGGLLEHARSYSLPDHDPETGEVLEVIPETEPEPEPEKLTREEGGR